MLIVLGCLCSNSPASNRRLFQLCCIYIFKMTLVCVIYPLFGTSILLIKQAMSDMIFATKFNHKMISKIGGDT